MNSNYKTRVTFVIYVDFSRFSLSLSWLTYCSFYFPSTLCSAWLFFDLFGNETIVACLLSTLDYHFSTVHFFSFQCHLLPHKFESWLCWLVLVSIHILVAPIGLFFKSVSLRLEFSLHCYWLYYEQALQFQEFCKKFVLPKSF